VIIVTYQKPQVLAVVNAASAVQSTGKTGAQGDAPLRTAAAYEADE
jgi:hypothetical protein